MGIQAMALLLLSLAIPNLVNCNIEGDILHAQRIAWVDPHEVLQSWDPTLVNPCTWYHVTCNNDDSVIRVDLGNAGLSGPLVPQLGGLKNLQYLELFGNNITGAMPSTFGNLTNLVSLDLYYNVISGVIPPALGNLRSLKYLRLNGNNLTGALPVEVLNLATIGSLEILNVSDNSLAGTVTSSHYRVTSIIQDESSRTPPSEET